jgi:hypothetical protein
MKIKIFLVGKGPICELDADFNIKVSSLKQRVLSETGIPTGALVVSCFFLFCFHGSDFFPTAFLCCLMIDLVFLIFLEQQSLFYAGKRLSDDKSLFESDLPAKSDVVTLLLMTVRVDT